MSEGDKDMRMTQKSVLSMSAVMMLAALAACSDPATGPSPSRTLKVNLAVSTPPAVTLGQITVCKNGNTGGSFDVTGARSGQFASGLNTLITEGTCVLVATDNSTDNGVGSNISITEDAAANVTSSITGCRFRAAGGVEGDCTD